MRAPTAKIGQAFENLIDYTNQVYKNQGRALINKRPTPVKVTKSKGTQVLRGYFESKSTVDYDGVYRGKPIYFEAKTVGQKRLPLDTVADHQVKYLNDTEKQGAISFLIAELRKTKDIFIIPNNMLQKYIKAAENGGRKSIPLDDLEVYAFLAKSGNGAPLDYLSVVDRLIEENIA